MTESNSPPGIPSPARLASWLNDHVPGGPVELTDIQLIAGGRSNLTYRLTVSAPGAGPGSGRAGPGAAPDGAAPGRSGAGTGSGRHPAAGAAQAPARSRAAHRPRHVSGIPRPVRARGHPGARRPAGGVVHRRRGDRRALLRDGVRARGGAADPRRHRGADRGPGRGPVAAPGRHARRDPRRRRQPSRARRPRPRRRVPAAPARPLAAAVGAVRDPGDAGLHPARRTADRRAARETKARPRWSTATTGWTTRWSR